MSEFSVLLDCLSEEAIWELDKACCAFEKAWLAGARPRVEDFVVGLHGPEERGRLFELLRLELHYRRRAGEAPRPDEYETRFPKAATLLSRIFDSSAQGEHDTIDDPVAVDSHQDSCLPGTALS